MQSFNAFTLKEKKLINVLKTQVGIFVDNSINPNYKKIKENFVAIWDTGATNTVISEKLASELNLTPIGVTKIRTAGGVLEAKEYLVGLELPNDLQIENIMVTAGNLGNNTDFLIGMDIISLGDFSVTNVNNQTVFSFRYPSCETIDYVEEAKNLHRKDLQRKLKKLESDIKKSGKCSCGSGKQYRYCHGKKQMEDIKKEMETISS